MLTEIIVSASSLPPPPPPGTTSQQPPSSSDHFISVHDLHASTHLSTFKSSCSPLHGTSVSPSHLLAAQVDKAILNVYQWNKEACDQRIPLPEKLACIALSPCSTFLAAGSGSGRLFLWELASGNLVWTREAHYAALTSLAWTKSSSHLITASADSAIHIWRTADLLSVSTYSRPEDIQPLHTLSTHTLAITSLHVGAGSQPRLYTASEDGTIRVWELGTGECLTTFVCSSAVSAMTVDPAERAIYAGTPSGSINLIPLYSPTTADGAIGGMGSIHTLAASSSDVLTGHESPITALSLSFDATLLVSGDNAGQVLCWDLATRQMVRKFKTHKGPVSGLWCILKPPSLGSSSSLGSSKKTATGQIPALKRVQSERDRDEHNVVLSLQPNILEEEDQDEDDDVAAARRGLSEFGTQGSESTLRTQVQTLQEELSRLYGAYEDLRGVMEGVWRGVVGERVGKKD
ncbi:Pre-rRNA-processing protein ipi3 [Saitoella coloradoensis]